MCAGGDRDTSSLVAFTVANMNPHVTVTLGDVPQVDVTHFTVTDPRFQKEAHNKVVTMLQSSNKPACAD